MKNVIIFLVSFMIPQVAAQVLKQNGGIPSNINGSGNCFSIDSPTFVVDCTNNRVAVGTGTPNVLFEIQSPTLNATKFRLDGSQYSGAQNIKIEFNASGSDGLTQEYGRINVLTDPTGSEIGIMTLGANAGGANSPLSITNGRVGIGANNTAPATTLDALGSAQFGSGSGKSTFTATGFWEPLSQTKAQIDLLVPTKVGQVVYASNTTLPGLCISTGTSAAQWRKMESATLGCGTNN